MSCKMFSLAILAAAFTLVLGATDAEAFHHRGHRHGHRHGCCNSNTYGGNSGYQQASYTPSSGCCAANGADYSNSGAYYANPQMSVNQGGPMAPAAPVAAGVYVAPGVQAGTSALVAPVVPAGAGVTVAPRL